MERIEERMKGHFVPCEEDDLLWDSHNSQDPESPKAWALPLFFAVGNDVSPLAMAVLCERLWNICHLRRDGVQAESVEERDIWFVTSGVWVTCWPHVCIKLYCLYFSRPCSSLSPTATCLKLSEKITCHMFPHKPNVEECLKQAPMSSKTSGGACMEALKAERCLWKTGYPRSGTPTSPFLPGLLTPILSVRSFRPPGMVQGGALQDR